MVYSAQPQQLPEDTSESSFLLFFDHSQFRPTRASVTVILVTKMSGNMGRSLNISADKGRLGRRSEN